MFMENEAGDDLAIQGEHIGNRSNTPCQSFHTGEKQMNMDRQRHHSHLFTVRLWSEEVDNGRKEWRGKVQQVHSGEAYYFCEWATLIAALLQMLAEAEIEPEAE